MASSCSASRRTMRITRDRSSCSSGCGRTGRWPRPGAPMADRVRQGNPAGASLVGPLFDAYRQFYEQPSDPALARAFIGERLAHGESVIFLAERGDRPVGFVQLFPLFSSTAARPRRLWLLNDLYVAPEARGSGVARALMQRA